MSLVICVVSTGRRKGKTAVIERLTKRFASQGLRVATVKHITGHFDAAEKDTWRHLEAGATVTVASTPREIVVITKSMNLSLEKALEHIHVQTELTFVEGYKNSSYPKILCADTAEDAKSALKEISNVVMISGEILNSVMEREKLEAEFEEPPVYDFEEMVSALKEMLEDSITESLPGLNCKECGYDSCLDLVKATLAAEATVKDCKVRETNVAYLKVDGKMIPIGKFPQEIIRGMTLGMVESLKGVKRNPCRIEITVKASPNPIAD